MADVTFEKVPLLAALGKDEQTSLAGILRFTKLASGEVLFNEGDKGDRMYIILKGELDVYKRMDTADSRLLARMRDGEFFGELSLVVKDGLRTASVRAATDTELVAILQEDFHKLLRQRPSMAYAMVQELGERLRHSDESAVADLIEKNRELQQAYEDLKAAQAELVEQEKLRHELSMARDIQMSILPKELHAPPGCDFGATMQPARSVGGDFYDFVRLSDDKVGIAIGDVSDKGVPAALFMAQVCTLLRALARQLEDPAEVLRRVNADMAETNDAGLFVTMVYGVFDRKHRVFHYARAGHEVPVLFTADGTAHALPYGQGTPLGIFPDSPLDVQTVELPAGSTLFMYTDGGVDGINEGGGFFGLEGLQDTVRAHLKGSAQDLCDAVLERVRSFQNDNQFDDATLVAIRMTG
ncbi:MAG: cyclic nucleotide-binding domain-containing protein [Anaerolineae bacterium]|nr:MAG: cyclic nucleotide-binding domain-containing protein [Anaerolineae bacterium]